MLLCQREVAEIASCGFGFGFKDQPLSVRVATVLEPPYPHSVCNVVRYEVCWLCNCVTFVAQLVCYCIVCAVSFFFLLCTYVFFCCAVYFISCAVDVFHFSLVLFCLVCTLLVV